MTTTLAPFTPARELPNGDAFYSPLGLFEFQINGVVETHDRLVYGSGDGVLTVYDTGIGKTIMFCALAAYMLNDAETDLALVICERNKLRDWRDAFTRFTNLEPLIYHGAGRQKRLAKRGRPHVLITTYETASRELMATERRPGRKTPVKVDGPLWDALGLAECRTLWGLDEVTKVMTRSSKAHQALDYALNTRLRKLGLCGVVGYTATPISKNFEQGYNIGRIICPSAMPTVSTFESEFCRGRDDYGNLRFDRKKEHLFAAMFQGLMLRKRKTDPDVIDQFPDTVEKSIKVEQTKSHKEFYRIVAELFDPEDPDQDDRTPEQVQADERRLRNLLRMTAGHPASHLHARNETSHKIADTLGADELRSIGAPKVDSLLTYLKPIVKGQGDQVVIFTFYRTVLYELCRELQEQNYSVATYHGQNTNKANQDAEDKFRAGEVEILLCTDAAAKGLNLQSGSYCIEYESASTYLTRTQRLNRIHRIDSQKSLVTFYTMLLEDTVEEEIINTVMNRNEKQDTLVGDEEDDTEFVSAATRRENLELDKK